MSTNCGPSGDELARALDRLMRRVEAGVHLRASAIDADRIGPLGGMVLLTLADLGAVPVQTLVAMSGRDKSQITRLVQMLEGKGAVTRRRSAEDGRISLIALSDKGTRMVADLRRIMASVVDEMLAPLPEAERAALARTIMRL